MKRALDRNRLSHTERVMQHAQDLAKESKHKKGVWQGGAAWAVVGNGAGLQVPCPGLAGTAGARTSLLHALLATQRTK